MVRSTDEIPHIQNNPITSETPDGKGLIEAYCNEKGSTLILTAGKLAKTDVFRNLC